MTDLRYFFWFVVAIIAGIVGIWMVSHQNHPDSSDIRFGTAIGERIPHFQTLTINGSELKTNDLHGRILVINTFASWCGPCRAETPELVKFYLSNQDKVMVIGLNVGENEAAVLGYQQDFRVPYPLVIDPGDNISELFRPRGLPTTWFIDSQGIIQVIHIGPLTADLMAQIVNEIQ